MCLVLRRVLRVDRAAAVQNIWGEGSETVQAIEKESTVQFKAKMQEMSTSLGHQVQASYAAHEDWQSYQKLSALDQCMIDNTWVVEDAMQFLEYPMEDVRMIEENNQMSAHYIKMHKKEIEAHIASELEFLSREQ